MTSIAQTILFPGVKEPRDDLICELVEALKLSLRYLEHPDVDAMPFALPASGAALRVRGAIQRATGAAPVAVEREHQQLDLLAVDSEVAGAAPLI